MSNAIINAVKAGSFTLAGNEIAKASERLSKSIRLAGSLCPNLAALNEVVSGYREKAKGKNRLGEYANYLAEGFNSAHPEHPVFWHRNGDAGPGSLAQFHAHPDPAKVEKAKTAPAPVADTSDTSDTSDTAPAPAPAPVADTIELDGEQVLEALRLALENEAVTLAQVEAICLGFAARMKDAA